MSSITQLNSYQRSPWCFQAVFTIQSHNVTHCQVLVSDCDLRSFINIPHNFSCDLCRRYSQQFVRSVHLWRTPITESFFTRFFFFCHICQVQPGVLFYLQLNSSIWLQLIRQRKKSAKVSFIKAFWQLSLQRNHIFPRERSTVGQNCHSRTMLDQDCLSVWVSRHRGACNFNRYVIFINQPVFLTELDCLCVTVFTGNEMRQNGVSWGSL